jgi:RND family efflux transporter MFP subunit
MFHTRRVKSSLLFVALLTLALATALVDTDGSATEAPIAVPVAQVREQEIPALIEVAGTVQAAERAAIAAKVTGVITQVPVVLGSTVKAGDLLVAISAEEITARLAQAEAQLTQARRNLEREQNLLAKNAATPETVKSMQDQFNIAQAGYREAKTILGYTTLIAPFDGVVTRKNVNSGDLATPGTVLLQVENNRKLQVHMAVPESLVLGLHPGAPLGVKVEVAGVAVQGTVAEVAPAADPASRTAPVVIDLPAHPNLRTGQFARVLLPGTGTRALLVPSSALVPSGQMDRIFVVAGERVQLRLVRTGACHDGMTEILAGLSAGETVVAGNNQLLVHGQPLRVQP